MSSENLPPIRKSKSAIAFLIFILFYIICFPRPAAGQSGENVEHEYSGVKQNVAEVRIDGNFLFFVRGILLAAEFRAETIINRIRKTGADPSVSADSIKIITVFIENDVQITTPAYRGDPEEPKVVPGDQWNKPLAGKEE